MKPTQPLHGRLGSPSQIAPRKGKVSGARAALEALQWTDAQVDTMPWIWLAIAIRVIPMQSIPCHPVQQMRVMDSMFHVKPPSGRAFKRQRPMPWVDRENEEWAVWACPLGCVVVRPMGSCELNDRQTAVLLARICDAAVNACRLHGDVSVVARLSHCAEGA